MTQRSREDRYGLERGRVLLTGVQTLVRLLFDQHRADLARGLRTASFVSGYQGSPLGGLDKELSANAELCAEHDIHHVPGLNEELGATSAWGSQLAGSLPGARFDGVVAMWYGKSPGLDRAADALRHANYVGTARTGGAVAAVGDDPASKSSTVPSASESILAALEIPVFFPGSVQETLDLGLHAYACSRASGLWSALKMVTSVADAVGTVDVSPGRVEPVIPDLGYEHTPSGHLLAPVSLEMERSLSGVRKELCLAYARANAINRVEGAAGGAANLGVVAAGRAYHDLRRALDDLGIDERGLEEWGIRILRLGMIWPLDREIVRDFAAGLDEILVVEEKRPFLEPQVKSALYGTAGAPLVVGERDELGAPLVPSTGVLNPAELARLLGSRIGRHPGGERLAGALARLEGGERELISIRSVPGPTRIPFFCSGCPHNSSLPAPDDTLVGVGIGCHTMVVLSPEGKGRLTGITQMGGEGAQWIGMAPFTERTHFVQNVGDGTFFHSASLAVRAAVAAGANITYKLLYNGHVAMTGGQPVEGALPVAELTRLLELEGVRRIIVTAEDLGRYKGVKLAAGAELRDRSQLLASQEELAAIEGVTVLIHDQQCAAEKRRMVKRGLLPKPADRIWVNERVCEGCGDCGRKSTCLSVVPKETEFGRKVRIDQGSCNDDRTCLEGDCPSFVTVVPGERKRSLPPAPPELPEPKIGSREFTARIVGIGGTGIVTGNHVVAMAALIDGLHVSGLDQTGLAQKGGPVISDLRISEDPILGGSAPPAAGVDLYLALDVIAATAPAQLGAARSDRTVAVVSTARVPTGLMVGRPDADFPDAAAQIEAIEGVTRAEENLYLDAREISERLFGDAVSAQVLAVGAAVQKGLIPVSPAAVEASIRFNGASIERNLLAFAWGRAAVAAPEALAALTTPAAPARAELDDEARELIESVGVNGSVRDLLETRVPELIAYQSARYAKRYVERLRSLAEAEAAAAGGSTELTAAAARNLFKLMAYKDEYEVARLHLDPAERERIEAEFGPGARATLQLHPPALRALGLKRKIGFGPRSTWMLRALRRGRRLRGGALDPFGKAHVRKVERELIAEYEETLDLIGSKLTPASLETCLELCELPDSIRGYEQIKLDSVRRYREQRERLLALLRS